MKVFRDKGVTISWSKKFLVQSSWNQNFKCS